MLTVSGAINFSGQGFRVFSLEYIIPANTIIMFDGANPAVNGWSTYSAADGRYVMGTNVQARVGVTTNISGNANGMIELALSGAHAGVGPTFKNNWFAYPGTFGSSQALTSGTAGSHAHSATVTSSGAYPIANVLPWTSDITFLIATSDQREFPPNTIHIRNNADSGWTQKTATNPGSPYFNTVRNIRGTPGAVSPGETSYVSVSLAPVSSSSGGTHDHYIADTAYRNPATGTSLGGSSYLPPSPSFVGSQTVSPTAQAHTHTVSSTFAIKNLQSKALKLWVAAQASGLLNDTMVMYAGNISTLPSYWKLCNGSGGTVDMSNVYLSHSSSVGTVHGATFAKNANLIGSAAPVTWTHNHGYGTGGAPSAGYATKDYIHTSGPAPHGHSYSSTTTITETYKPNTIELAFIQFIPTI
jgi:hypothetical protein